MEKEGSKLWRLTKALNDENPQKTNTALTTNGSTVCGKKAADVLAKQYETASTVELDPNRAKKVKNEIKRIRKPASHHKPMEDDITLSELKKNIKNLKGKNPQVQMVF